MKILIHAHWKAKLYKGEYFIQSTHNSYLEYLSQSNVLHVLCHVEEVQFLPVELELVKGVFFINIPSKAGYLNSYISIVKISRVFFNLEPNFDLYYLRVPDPLGWLFSYCLWRRKVKGKIVHHYVGDSIDATINSSSPMVVKVIKILLYIPEYILTIISSRFWSNINFCNGNQMSDKLSKFSVKSQPVISSTLSKSAASQISNKNFDLKIAKFLYVGYVRKSKGVMDIVLAFERFIADNPKCTLTIVGDGDDYKRVFEYVLKNKLSTHIIFLGHIDSKAKLTSIFDEHDCFCFASLSEGSPRVIIEAMFSGLLVLTTRVGSLPYCFVNKQDLIFTDDYGADSFFKALISLKELSSSDFNRIRLSGQSVATTRYTKESFLDRVFHG